MLGKLFPNSPAGKDGKKPCEAVRRFIEENADESMISEYVITEVNKRGMYSPTAGENEKEISISYQKESDYFAENGYFIMGKIYHLLSEDYMRDNELERKNAEDDIW